MSKQEEQSRRKRGNEKEPKKELSDVITFFILFTQVYPAVTLVGYVSGFMDVQLTKIASDSMSAGLDIVLLTVAVLCAVVGPGASIFAKDFLEK